MTNDYLEINLHSVNDRVKFDASARDNAEIAIDYFPPLGNGEGYTSLELVLISLASCISTTLLTILRSLKHKTVTAITAKAQGTVRTEHPKALSRIQLTLSLSSPDASEADLNEALALAEQKLCPVWAMLKGNTEISVFCSLQP